MNKGSQSKKKYVMSLFRVFLVLFVALILPQFFFSNNISWLRSNKNSQAYVFKLGIENISSEFIRSLALTDKKNKKTVGLVTNHTGLDQKGQRNIDTLLSKGLLIKKIYIPEDDFIEYKKGNNWEMIDDQTNIPIVMLAHLDSLKKSKEYALHDIDVIFFDMQDTGMHPNDQVNMLAKILQSASSQNKIVIVLDRPNVLGASMEGMIHENTADDTSLIPLPMRHGMTMGEIAQYINTSILAKAASLYVIPMVNYNRSVAYAGTLTHNSLLTNIDAYYGSSFLNILSCVHPFDIGIGTDMVHQCLALPESLHVPKQKWFELRTLLKKQGIQTSWYRYTNKKNSYAGLRLFVPNIEEFSPFNTIVTIIHFFKEAGVILTFGPDFDRAFGGKKVRDFLDGKFSRHDLECEVNRSLKKFFNRAHNSFIYKPTPKIIFL